MKYKHIADVIKIIFKTKHLKLQGDLNLICQEQYKLLDTPNFIYKGKNYVVRSYENIPIKPLDKSLKPKFEKYFNEITELEMLKESIVSYLINNNIKVYDDFYVLLPTSCHQYLEECFSNTYNPSIDTKPSNYDDIAQAINEYMLMDLL
ncbi:hypothetical protein ACF3N0_00205 [Moraxella atlantae]|uniref:hypothetical protein n=1 Tax=Faucicola atlantae TaxID=34059 RepID=UPI003751D5F7